MIEASAREVREIISKRKSASRVTPKSRTQVRKMNRGTAQTEQQSQVQRAVGGCRARSAESLPHLERRLEDI